MHFQRISIALSILVIWSHLTLSGAEPGAGPKKGLEAPSPDGQFAFRYSGEANSPNQTYDLIDKASRKVLLTVATADPEIEPSARFSMEVLWRPDSKAFAVQATLWKRGSEVLVFLRDRPAFFREIKVPELTVDIPDTAKNGKSIPHISELNSQSAKRWQKDGSLVVEIETMEDGEGGSITARRTVVLGFDRPGKASILKSTTKYETETDLAADAEAAWDKGDINAALAMYNRAIKAKGGDVGAYYYRGCANYVNRDWPKALADFQRHCDLRKGDKYQVYPVRFYIWLIRARLGGQDKADKELAPFLEGHPAEWNEWWDAKIGHFLLGKISEEELIAALGEKSAAAWFYAGMKRLINKDPATAAEDFKKAVAADDKTAYESALGEAELKALAK